VGGRRKKRGESEIRELGKRDGRGGEEEKNRGRGAPGEEQGELWGWERGVEDVD